MSLQAAGPAHCTAHAPIHAPSSLRGYHTSGACARCPVVFAQPLFTGNQNVVSDTEILDTARPRAPRLRLRNLQ